MARILHCRFCRVQLEAVPIAGGHATVICLDCDLIGLAHEVEHGAPLHAAEQAGTVRRKAVRAAGSRDVKP